MSTSSNRARFDLRSEGNRTAAKREFIRRTGSTPDATVEQQPRIKVRLLDDGDVDPECPVHLELTARYDRLQTMPPSVKRVEAAHLLRDVIPSRHWRLAIKLVAPDKSNTEPSQAHMEIYRWWHGLERDERPDPLVVCVNRGGGKTTSLELLVAFCAMEQLRSYCLFIHAAQKKAADSVGNNISEILMSDIVATAWPKVAQRYKTAQGTGRDWRKDRVRTMSGFTCDALGMDMDLRGANLDGRPDMLILDDLEASNDTPYMTNKREETLTHAIIPLIGDTGAIAYAQNMIGDDTVMARLVKGTADYLATRHVIGPIPQLTNFTHRVALPEEEGKHIILTGTPTWAGLDLEDCQKDLNDLGLGAFLSEKQHETSYAEGTTFPRTPWVFVDSVPADTVRLCRGWDLAVTEGGGDWTVGCLMGMDRHSDIFILDIVRGQWSDSNVEAKLVETTRADRAKYGRVDVAIESPYGMAAPWARRLEREVMLEFGVKLIKPQGKKEARAMGYASVQQQGRAHLVINDEWNAEFILEHARFPDLAKHDDQVDAAAHAFNRLSATRRRRATVATAAGRTI